MYLIAGGLYWYLSSNSDIPNEKIEKPSTKGDGPSKDNEKIKEKNQIEKINVFPLEPFFIPLELDNPATGQFVSIKLSFVISNRKMNREINKNIGEIRGQIYHILRGKKAITYIEDMENLKKGLKQEIATISNNLLVSGAGTISEVLFTDFVIR